MLPSYLSEGLYKLGCIGKEADRATGLLQTVKPPEFISYFIYTQIHILKSYIMYVHVHAHIHI